MTSQQAFEKAYPMPLGATRMGDAYSYAATDNINTRIDQGMHADRWETWQASRQALEVELPSGFSCGEGYFSQLVMGADEVKSSIRAAGIRIKGDL